MTEPRAVASRATEVADGVWSWWVEDDRIGGSTSAAHAVRSEGGFVLVDPLPLADGALAELAPVEAICLTAQCHQRSAWRYRRSFGAPVHAPEGTRPLEQEPDARYAADDELPGSLRAVHTPGPEPVHYAFLLEREPGTLFCPDLLMLGEEGELDFVPFEYHDDPASTWESVERLRALPFSVLCLAHGRPVVDDPKARIRRLLERRPRP